MTDLISMTIAEARNGLANKSFTSLELTDAHLAAIEAARALNAFVLETPDKARAMARAIDAKIAKGEGGPLAGIPLGIKDLFATKDVRTTACSKILGNFVPPYKSTVTSQLWRDGAVMLGKLNNDEFAMGSSNETSCFGPVVNPVAARRLQYRAGAGRLIGRLGFGGGGTAVHGRDRDRHRRFDPPAGGVHRALSASSRPMAAARAGASSRLRPRSTRPGRSRAARARRRDPDALDGGARSQGHDVGRSSRCRTTRRRSENRSRA